MAALGLCLAMSLPSQGELVNRWSFNDPAGNAADGTVLTDSVSGAVASVQGNFSQFTGTSLRLQGSTGDNTTTGNRSAGFISGYVDLPNGMISARTDLSVELWATPLSARNYQRVFDFGRIAGEGSGGGEPGEIIDINGVTPGGTSASDNLFLSFCIGESLEDQRLEALLDGGSKVTVDTALTTTAGTPYHYVLTFEDLGAAGGRMTWYRNGELAGSGDVGFHLSDLEDVNNWLGRSMWTGDRNAHAEFSELRFYDHVLSTDEISANLAAGPDTIVEEPLDPEPAPQPDHLWVFNEAADSTVDSGLGFADSVGGMVATLRGNGATLTGTALRLPGSTLGNQSAASISAYLDLPNGIISAQPSITLEAWVTPLSSKAYQRLFDFGRTNVTSGEGAMPGEIIDGSGAPGAFAGYDNFVLSLNVGNNLGTHRLEGQIDNGAAIYTDSTATTAAGTQYHYVLVLEDGVGTHGANGCQIRWYRNGVLQNTLDLDFHLSEMQDVNNWIGRSQYSGDSCSNLALNELRIYRRAVTPGEVLASYTAGPDPDSGPAEPPVPAPPPLHRWSFDGPAGAVAAGSLFVDSATNEIATLRGNGATLDGTAIILPGTTDGNQTEEDISAYLDLPNGIFSSAKSFSMEAWLTPLSSRNWQRIFDLGSSNLTSGNGAANGEIIDGPTTPGGFIAADNLLLSLNVGGVLGNHRLESRLGGGSAVTFDTDLAASTPTGTEHHYVLTVQDAAGASGSSGCQAKWYRNGELQGSIDLPYRVADMADVNNWIGRSLWAGDMNSNLALNELRIYPGVLSAGEVLASHANGASVVFPPPATTADSATIHAGQKVRIAVLANDTGAINPASVEIVTPPASGTATVDAEGQVLYGHAGGGSDPVTFTYRVSGEGGLSEVTTVTVQISSELRIATAPPNVPSEAPATAIQVVPAFPGLTFTKALCFVSPPGDTQRLFVCELGGKLKVIPDVTAEVPGASLVLDIVDVVSNPPREPVETITPGPDGECGLLGLAFHPQFAQNGYFFVTYSVVKEGSSGWFQRLSRFTMPPDQIGQANPVADPASELILIEQADREDNHNGGDLHFGADGFLYYAVGDEANANDKYVNSQDIDKNIFSAMLRIDVDKASGIEPNPHVSVPTDNGLARYSIPADNPFIGAVTFNGLPVNPAAVRTEFWATGLRSPWRFSFDPVTGELWLGDVGQGMYEEVDIIEQGGNYGWVYREGMHDTAFTNPVPPPKPEGFTSIDPIYEYVHTGMAGDSNYKGNSVIGGVVYRGSRIPSLHGKYIFGDQVSGHIWALDREGGVPGGTVTVERIGGQAFLSNFGTDPSNGDVLVSDYFGGRIMRIVSTTPDGSFPTKLSETGLFADLSDLSPSPGVLPYEPNLTFWSDYAKKRRWFTIPDPSKHMTWSRDGDWTFPDGQIWVKHFDLESERGNPASPKKRIETRVLVKNSTGMYGVSYRWNEAQTEATLADDGGEDFPVNLTVNGQPYFQQWRIPSRAQCMTCHSPQAGHALSFNTRQLNLAHDINGFSGNQIDLLSGAGYLSNLPESTNLLPRHLRPDETEYPLEARVRSYLAVNCAYCHEGAEGTAPTAWDARHHLTLEQTGLVNGEASSNNGNPANKLVVPGDLLHSIVLNRVAVTNGFSKMPPLGSNEIDQVNVELLSAWIEGTLPDNQTYAQWRLADFGSPDSPEGDPAYDADGDGVSNHEEFLAGTSPLDGSSFLRPTLTRAGEEVSIGFSVPANRSVQVQSSANLLDWSLWDVPGNDGVSLPAGAQSVSGTSADPARFFRLLIEER
jgi:uncharacterized repeat protein (TIGR03806 family)